MASLTTLNIPVFAGQGTQAAKAATTRQQALNDASSNLGALLLKSCHEAFLLELSSLTPAELAGIKIDPADFPNPESLLNLVADRYDDNPVISGTTLFLIQSLRYLSYVEATASATGSLTPFSDFLETNIENKVGIAGFSSGIVAACLVASSQTSVTYLAHAVELYRLAFWIGVRCQQYLVDSLETASVPLKWHSEPWSQVIIGCDKATIAGYIAKYHEDHPTKDGLALTAVTDGTCFTVSGRPDILSSFLTTLPDSIQIYKTAIDTLYHSSVHTDGAKAKVMEDIVRREIRCPTANDLKAPLRHSFDGTALDASVGASLVESIVDMILTQPVNWPDVMASLANAVPSRAVAHVVHFGPGTGLARPMLRAFGGKAVTTVNATVNEGPSADKNPQEPIAIIGMAVNMPGAPNVAKLWEVLEQGINTISEVPTRRFNVSSYNNPKDPKTSRSMKAHTGNFLEDPSLFDNKFFRISPREAKSMDPQQRIVLQTAYEALEDAGYVPNSTPTFQQDTFGCYIGVATDDYVQNLRNSIDVYYSPGTLRAFLSGRISYAMKMSGPSVVIDTACSSSTVSIYQACRALSNGDCRAAVAGGVNVIASPDMMIGLDRGHFLSPTGQCKAFDVSADGYSRSEGCGIFILKKLSDAIKENDKILGVIRGIEVNQSGNAHSITHPHAPTQMDLFEHLVTRTGVDRHHINVVEAHGTGTQAGDTNELESIRGTLAVKRTSSNPLHITTVKANIGHLEAASGAASLAKLLLMLRHKTIPRLVSLKTLNPRIAPLESDNTVLDLQNTAWEPAVRGKPRLAMLNNFGAAGSNAAVLLEEFSPSLKAKPEAQPFLFCLSAKSETSVNALKASYIAFLADTRNKDLNILDIAYTSTARRQIYDHHIAVTASSREELLEKLESASVQKVKLLDSNKAVFVFSGQGGQYLGMGKTLYTSTPLFKKHVDVCHELLVSMGFPGVLPILLSDGDSSNLSKFAELEAYQAAIFALEYSLAQLWLSWGLEPAAVVGHSVGEYAALVVAGVLPLKSALFVIGSRVRLMVEKCAPDSTGMMAVNLGPADVTKALASSPAFSNLSIACFNSPLDCVVGGPLQDLKAFKVHLDAEVRCKNVILTVPYGYHTVAMDPLAADLTAVGESVKLHPPNIPIVSNVTGTVVYPGDSTFFTADYFTRHCCQPVQFTEGVEALMNDPALAGTDCWIEIGPHPTTLPMIKSNSFVAAHSPILAASIRKNQDPWSTLATSLATMYAAGMPLKWRNVYDHVAPTCSELPAYPFENASFWVDFEEEVSAPVASVPAPAPVSDIIEEYSLIGSWVQRPSAENGKVGLFECPIESLATFITGHKVGDHPLCPASVYHELALAGAQLTAKHLNLKSNNNNIVLRSIDYAKPLIYSENDVRIVCTRISHTDSESGSFTVASRLPTSTDETVHCFGQFSYQSTAKTVKKFQHYQPILQREVKDVTSNPDSETISTRTVYELIFPAVVDYSKKYHSIKSITIHPNGHEAYALVQIPHQLTPGKFVHHPVWMDTMLHVAGFVANKQGNTGDAYICSQVDSVKVIPGAVDLDKPLGVYVRNAWVPEESVVIAEAWAFTLDSPQVLLTHFKRMHFRKVRLASFKRILGGPSVRVAEKAVPKHTASTPAPTRAASAPVARNAPKTASVSLQSEDVIRSKILSIIAETCDISPSSLKLSADLVALGVDSLMSIEIFGKLQQSFPESNLDAYTLSSFHTPAEIIAHVAEKQPSGALLVESRLPESTGSSCVDPDATQVASAVADDDADVDVKGIMASVLGGQVDDIKDDADLEALGLDSLTSIEALHALSSELSLELPQNLFTLHTTMRAVEDFIDGLRHSKKAVVKTEQPASSTSAFDSPRVAAFMSSLGSLPVPLQRSPSSKPSLFLIHDGSGLVNYYQSLSPLDRNVWGLYNPKFSAKEEWTGLKSMATEYASLVRKSSSGPLILGGWSFGGVVAFEAAKQLLSEGVSVSGVLLIDSPCPVNHVPLSEALIESVVSSTSSSSKSEISQLIKRQFRLNAQMLGQYDVNASSGPLPKVAILRSRDGVKIDGASVPTWLADRSDKRQVIAEWETLLKAPIKSWDIPGNHFEPFAAANVKEVSRCIAEGCEYLSASV
ncbi:ketoacyl-synt-domain-containing protein [Agrocybe pediades]|nr:ketoacyl-synt-domain-containing protein [Agrocybe pediades]